MFLQAPVILSTVGAGGLADTPPRRRPLQRTVRILLECILVSNVLDVSHSNFLLYFDVASFLKCINKNITSCCLAIMSFNNLSFSMSSFSISSLSCLSRAFSYNYIIPLVITRTTVLSFNTNIDINLIFSLHVYISQKEKRIKERE